MTNSVCPYCKLMFTGARCKRQSCAMRRYMDNKGPMSDIREAVEGSLNAKEQSILGTRFYSTDKEVIDTVGVVIEED